MNWATWQDFVHMGGYGLYVWGSMAMCAAVLTLEIVLVRQRRKAALAAVRQHVLLNAADDET